MRVLSLVIMTLIGMSCAHGRTYPTAHSYDKAAIVVILFGMLFMEGIPPGLVILAILITIVI